MKKTNENTNLTAFAAFLKEVEQTNYPTNITATGALTIQQTTRNELRRKGVKALLEDLDALYGDTFDIVETKEGIIIVVENAAFTFSWELKSTIKALDFDPFIEATKWEDEEEAKRLKKENREKEKLFKEREIEEKRQRKLAEIKQINQISQTNQLKQMN